MNIAAGRGFGRVDVAVGVDPQQADALMVAAIKFGDPADGARGDGVVAAKRERNLARFERLDHQLGLCLTGFGDLLQSIWRCGSPSDSVSSMATETLPASSTS